MKRGAGDQGVRGPRAPYVSNGRPRLSAKKIAQMMQMKTAAAYPRAQFGTTYTRRGVPGSWSMNEYGSTWRTANPDQRIQRKEAGYTGAGMYMGGAGAYKPKVNRFKKANKWLGFAGSVKDAGMQMLGQGEYTSNSIVSGAGSSQFAESVPSFRSTGEDGAITIVHKEYITDIYGNSAAAQFNNTMFTLNPGIERTFPWLAQIAANFEEYTLNQCIFTFRSLITQDSTIAGGQVGTIVMATNYNVGNPPFTDKATMMQYAKASSSRVTDTCLHGIECDPSINSGSAGKYVRSGPVLVGQDPKTYDVGLFQIAVSGTPTGYVNQPIGELWVSYSVSCRKPRLFTGLGSAISTDYYAGSTACTPALPFGTNVLSAQQNNLGTSLTQAGGVITITFPATFTGVVRCTLFIAATFTTFPVTNVTAGGAATLPSDMPVAGGSNFFINAPGSAGWVAGGTNAMRSFDVRCTTNYGGASNTATITLPAFTVSSWSYTSLSIVENNELSQVPGSVPALINSSGVVTIL